ncbi:unnamed protein product [Penicillium pancosmium]
MIDIVELISRIPGYKDIPLHFKRIYYDDVQFKLCKWTPEIPETQPYLSIVGNEHVIDSPQGAGGNHTRRAKRHALKLNPTGQGHMEGVKLEVSVLKDQLVWDGKNPRLKYGVLYPMRFFKRDSTDKPVFYGVRRTKLDERYLKENYLYGGLNEEPNILVDFRNVHDSDAAERGDTIKSTHLVRIDFYDAHTKEHIGWLKNDPDIASIQAHRNELVPKERGFIFHYV